eukprot:15858288-Heterocapsa_arctica.AAC.1
MEWRQSPPKPTAAVDLARRACQESTHCMSSLPNTTVHPALRPRSVFTVTQQRCAAARRSRSQNSRRRRNART